MDVVEELVAGDPRIKGMWCVPKYSNPTGACYSPATIKRLAGMRTAAGDFRLFWDNAYAVHYLTLVGPAQIAPVLDACERAFVFGSTSKITYTRAGVAFFGSSPANISWFLGHLAKQTIGPDKLNQLRHARLPRSADGVLELMDRHRQVLAPKFALVDEILHDGLTGIASWTLPEGGHFMTLDVPDGCASAVVRLAADAGMALTPAGATHPHGRDPRDRTIRLAPTFPSLTDLEQAMRGRVTCVRLAAGGRNSGRGSRLQSHEAATCTLRHNRAIGAFSGTNEWVNRYARNRQGATPDPAVWSRSVVSPRRGRHARSRHARHLVRGTASNWRGTG